MLSIDPRIAVIINIVIALLTAITTGALNLAGVVPSGADTQISAWAAAILVVLSTIMHYFSSSVPGPGAPPDPPNVQKAMADNAKIAALKKG